MGGPYSDLSDADLLQEIVDYRAIQKTLATGGDVAVVAGEGRRVEYTRSSAATATQTLRELLAERDRRPSLGGCGGGSALGVVIYQ